MSASDRDPQRSAVTGASGPIDLGKLAESHDVKLTVAPAESPEDAALRRSKDKALFVLSVTVLGVLFVGSLIALAIPTVRADLGGFAQSIVSAIVGLLGGYALGKRGD